MGQRAPATTWEERLRGWLVGAVALTGCAAVGAGPNEPPPAPRPHIVVVLADDLGYGDLGFTGCTDFPTPHLDALARRGIVCTDGHVSASVCAPSRAGLLTGRYQQRSGFECNLGSGDGLLPGTTTFAGRLRGAGYATALVGKWHLGSDADNHPAALGFDHFSGILSGSRSYFPIEGAAVGRSRRIERDGVVVPETDFEYLTDFLTDEGVRLIDEHDPDRPLLLFLSYTAPHGPLQARPELLERFESTLPKRRATYAAMVTSLDEGVGRIQAALARRGMLDNTLTVFLSDNGGATNNASDNGPWRGMKGSKWEGGLRVPFVVQWPNTLPAGTFAGAVSSLDLAPTFLAAAGAVPLPVADGVDLLPILQGARQDAPEALHHRPLFWRRAVAAAARIGPWKLIRVDEADGTRRAPILVDLDADPGELTDVSTLHPGKVHELNRALEAWETEMLPPSWLTAEIWRENQRQKHRLDVIGREAERRLP